MYLRDIEGFTCPFDNTTSPANSVATPFLDIGFPIPFVCSTGVMKHVYESCRDRLHNALKYIKTHVPESNHLAAALGGVAKVVINVPGPITREYTVVNQTIPVTLPQQKPRHFGDGKACVIARIELFNDKLRRKRLITQTLGRLRLLDPSLLPWNIDETIASKNPQVLENDHFIQTHCHAALWARTYAQSTTGAKNGVDPW